jgi:hypothetical protein
MLRGLGRIGGGGLVGESKGLPFMKQRMKLARLFRNCWGLCMVR